MFAYVTIAALVTFAVVGSRLLPYRVFLRCVVALVIFCIATENVAANIGVPLAYAGIAQAIAVACAIAFAVATSCGVRRAWLAEAAVDPLVLAPPFAGRWRVVAGGPDPGRNHHLVASEQRFAYDFMRIDGASLDSEILSPVAGRVIVARDGRPDHAPSLRPVEDGEPLGNHVAIDVGRGVVFLCHLKAGSVAVREGDVVAAGAPIGRCGNSGRTTRPHLHVHAQPEPEYTFGRRPGIPIAFAAPERATILRAGQALTSAASSAGVTPGGS